MSENILNRISQDIGRLEGKVDGINKRLDISNGRIAKNEEKINALESFKDNLQGRIVVVVAIVGLVVSFIGSFAKDIIFKIFL